MPGPFDAAFKQLVDAFAADWVGAVGPLVGLPATTGFEPLDADLSTVQPAVDKVFRLRPPSTGLLHLESQASWDGTFPDRLVLYNVLLGYRYGGPVYTVVLLLRRDAAAPNLTGRVSRTYPDGEEYLWFAYRTVRIWELPAESLLAAGLGATPLALLTDDAAPRLPELVARFAERVEQEAPDRDTGNLLLSCGYILLGLRYNDDVIRTLFAGVQRMRESSTYQSILNEGRAEGRAEGLETGIVTAHQEDVLALLQDRFGAVPPEVKARVRAATDPDRLRTALRQVYRIATPGELPL